MKSVCQRGMVAISTIALFAGISLINCSKSTESNDLVVSVAGFVHDSQTMGPLDGVRVTLSGATVLPAASTDATGYYRMYPNCYGTARMRCEKSGYRTRVDSVLMAEPVKAYYLSFEMTPVKK